MWLWAQECMALLMFEKNAIIVVALTKYTRLTMQAIITLFLLAYCK